MSENEETQQEESTKLDLPPFNADYWIVQLKKEVGLMEVPYEELGKYEVDLDSPFGRSKIKVNAKDYVDQQLATIEEDYNATLNGENDSYFDDVNIVLDTKTPPPQISAQPVQEIKEDHIKFYNVVINEFPYTVIINTAVGTDEDKWQVTDQINNVVTNTMFFQGEVKRNFLTGLESFISYYQYIDKISRIPRPQEPLTAYEMISDRMNTVFDSVKVNWDAL